MMYLIALVKLYLDVISRVFYSFNQLGKHCGETIGNSSYLTQLQIFTVKISLFVRYHCDNRLLT